jgi:transposase
MGRTKTLLNNNDQELLRMHIKSMSNSDVLIKLLAIQATFTHKESDVALIFSISRSTLIRWISNYKKFGISGCRSKKRGHNPSKLSTEQKEIIRGWILSSKDNKDNQVHWTLKRLIKEIHQVFNKEITKTPLWLTLISMNLSLKKPRPQHYKADEEKQEIFKKNSRND